MAALCMHRCCKDFPYKMISVTQHIPTESETQLEFNSFLFEYVCASAWSDIVRSLSNTYQDMAHDDWPMGCRTFAFVKHI